MVFKPLGCEPRVPGRWPQGLGNKGRPGWGGGGRTQPHGSLCRPSGFNGLAFEEHASAVSKLGKPSAYPKPTALLCSNDLRGPQPGLWAGGRCPQWPRHGVTAARSLPHAVSCRRQCPGSPELRGQCPERQIRMVSRRGSGFPGPQTLGCWGAPGAPHTPRSASFRGIEPLLRSPGYEFQSHSAAWDPVAPGK